MVCDFYGLVIEGTVASVFLSWITLSAGASCHIVRMLKQH